LKERISELEGPTFYEIVDFNPWSCFSYSQLVNQFFLQIKEVLTKYDGFERIQSDLTYYASVLVSAGGALPRVGWLLTVFGKLLCFDKNKSLVRIKADISNLLVDQKIHLVIAIDDSDRLLPDNLLVFLQFITTIVDFPNTAFLLAYSRQYFVTVLSKGLKNKRMATDFLEKIIDVPFDLPAIPPGLLREELEKGLKDYSKGLLTPSATSITGTTFLDKLSGSFTNFRQLKRFFNKLEIRRWQFDKGLDSQDVTVLAMLQSLFPEDCKIIFVEYLTFLKFLSYSSEDETEDPWLLIKNSKEIKAIFLRVFSSLSTYDNREKRLIDKGFFEYYFSSEDCEVLDEIESFVSLCAREFPDEQIQSFFCERVKDIYDFRRRIKTFFSTWSEEKQEHACSCYKVLIKLFDTFDPPDASAGVFEQNTASLVKFDYAMDFLGCVKKAKRVELLQEIFEKEKLEIAFYFFQHIFLNLAFDSAYIEYSEKSTEVKRDKDDKQKLLDLFVRRLKTDRSLLLYDETIWFTAFFLQLVDLEEISLELVQNTQKVPLQKCKKIIDDLFSKWEGGTINESFCRIIKPFFPKAKSGQYYFIRNRQYQDYSRIYNEGNLKYPIEENLIELGRLFKKDIERHVSSLVLTRDTNNLEQAKILICLVLYSEMNKEEHESVEFNGISIKSIEERMNQNEKEEDPDDKN
jgi:hypothetical protein